MSEPWYAIVFTRDVPKGAHPDPQQDWYAGDLFSVGTVVDHAALPDHFEAVPIDDAVIRADGHGPDLTVHEWNPQTRTFTPKAMPTRLESLKTLAESLTADERAALKDYLG